MDEDGTYAVDLGDTTPFPTGYDIGDEIQISITHRDTTRTWKRRVSGSELVQDVYLTHGTWRGALRKAKMIVTDYITATAGTTITLRDTHTTHVFSVKRNNSLLDEDEYTWTPQQTITFTAPLANGTLIVVERAIQRTPTDAKRSIVEHGDSHVRNATARYYPSPFPKRAPELQEISELLAASSMRHLIYSSGDKTDKDAVIMNSTSQKKLEEIRDGTRSLTDQDDAFITPAAKSVTTPQSSTTPTRKFTLPTTRKVDL